MSRKQRSPLIPLAMLGLLFLSSCSAGPRADYSELDLVEVTGQVTLDDVPLQDALVEFESPDLTMSSGRTDHNGEYRLMFDSQQPGCLPGEKIVRISMRPSGDEEDPDAAPAEERVIPGRYNLASELGAEVSADRRRFDFDLTTGQ